MHKFGEETLRGDGQNDFVEGLMYSRDSGVIMTGTLTDDAEPDKASAHASLRCVAELAQCALTGTRMRRVMHLTQCEI